MFGLKRVVMHPRAYLKPFLVLVLAHHLPFLLAYGLLDRPKGMDQCEPVHDMFEWLLIAFLLHIALAVVLVLDMTITLCSTVHRQRHPEHYLLLTVFGLYVANFAWVIYGETSFPSDTSTCVNDSVGLQEADDHITTWQHFDFVFSLIALAFALFTSLLCGVHSSTSIEEDEERWMRRCSCLFRTCTCQSDSMAREKDDEMFVGLARVLRKAFFIKDSKLQIERLRPNDVKLCLELVAQAQRDERDIASANPVPPVRFPQRLEQERLRDIAYFGRFAIGIYGWPMYVWYSPLRCCKIINCCARKHEDQVVDNDNLLLGNRTSFINYTGIQEESLAYLNCYNFVFSAPYSIVKDNQRRELIITVRGSLSIYDWMVDGLADSAAMDPDELPSDVPNPHGTLAHYGMLKTARSLFADLQQGSRKTIFWDFANAESANGWRVVVCGHSMGAGVGALLALLLRKPFPRTSAYLFAPPMLLDEQTAAYTKSFMTTVVYGDDIVPRCSIRNVMRLQQEMITQYENVANEPVYKIQLSRHRFTSVSSTPTPASNLTSTGYGSIDSNVLDAALQAVSVEIPEGAEQAPLSAMESSEDMIPEEEELDIPGQIVHVETVNKARRCGCTMLLGIQELTYNLRDASYFRRIMISSRSFNDHLVHHYDRDMRHLLECLGYSVGAHYDQQIVQVDPADGGRLTEIHGETALFTEDDIGTWMQSPIELDSRQAFAAMNQV